ncbi:MAG TPA: hypothetical protein VKV17_03230 [Bryobacteraceae bacterium]|nr:hypothetical protein [Bryobacteraceae bacterium]
MSLFFFKAAGACLLLCPAVPSLLAAQPASDGATRPAVAVFMDFDSKPGDVSVAAMQHEVEVLLGPSGIDLNWRMLDGSHATKPSQGLVVVRFHGHCKVEAWPQPGEEHAAAGTHTLGFTHVSGGHVSPFSEIECDQIRQALAYLAPDSTPGERQKAFGLAMGRVVAHELYHILARTTSHAEEGLAKATESLRDLVNAPAMLFSQPSSQAIGQGFTTNQ